MMEDQRVIVIGCSAGGIEALQSLVSELPADLSAAVFVVMHMAAYGPKMLASIIQRAGKLPTRYATNNEPFHPGHIYIAQPDHHILVENRHIRIVYGPKENYHRPAVDPLFRSAARSYGPRVIGVVMSGMLDDGTAGLLDIKRHGGVTAVQDPDEAMYPEMPQNALANVQVDYCLPAREIARLLARLAHESVQVKEEQAVQEDTQQEGGKANLPLPKWDSEVEEIGIPSPFSCPECDGVLWEIQDGPLIRYRCRVGHAFSPDTFLATQMERVEQTLWNTLRVLEETADLIQRMAEQARKRNQNDRVEQLEKRAQATRQQSTKIRRLLQLEAAAESPSTGERIE